LTLEASGIVLAGGRSARFGGDKLAAMIDGRTLLDRAIGPLAETCREVIVVVARDHQSATWHRNLQMAPSVRMVPDAEAFRGPLAGLATGLEAAAFPLVLVVGGDMPTLVVGVLELLLARLAAGDNTAAVLCSADRIEPLPVALRRDAALTAARLALGRGDRSLLALLASVRLATLPEHEWLVRDPEAATLHDVDVPADLAADAQRAHPVQREFSR
jgi:molybdopterin-guanine dinucleotide biosynthesis protein A